MAVAGTATVAGGWQHPSGVRVAISPSEKR